MKLQRTTVILLLLALGLSGFVYFAEMNRETQPQLVRETGNPKSQPEKQQIFSFQEDDIQSLIINSKNLVINLERNQKSEKPRWLLTSPQQVGANDAIAAYLLNLLVKGKSDRILSVAVDEIKDFGLAPPQARIDIQLKDKTTHTLILGQPTYNNSSLYAQLGSTENKNGKVNVLLVSKDFTNAVNRELAEWKQPAQTIQPKPLPSLPQPTPEKSE
ncbi:MAG: DUF4340 domain-containing protein [Calothrix sp. MO_167.B42]|nr:DUF4340 domain-containing protein [Calothrix sp. MO_167.B42]